MASVRVESEVHTDPRYAILGRSIKGNEFTAIGLMTRVWRLLQERWSPDLGPGGYCLSDDQIECLFLPHRFAKKLPEKLIAADLAERTPHGIRIKGAEGRIEWLWRKRQGAKAGGRARVRQVPDRDEAGRFGSADHQPMAQPMDGGNLVQQGPADSSPLTPALTPDSAQKQNPPDSDLSDSENRTTARRAPPNRKRTELQAKWMAGFPRFYDPYPRHEKRKDAEKAWLSLMPARIEDFRDAFNRIIQIRDLRMESWNGREKQHKPLPASFLRSESFTEQALREAILDD